MKNDTGNNDTHRPTSAHVLGFRPREFDLELLLLSLDLDLVDL